MSAGDGIYICEFPPDENGEYRFKVIYTRGGIDSESKRLMKRFAEMPFKNLQQARDEAFQLEELVGSEYGIRSVKMYDL